jgi:antitoxin component YwqK of YwqJK toxin-antitoxin module
VRSDPLKTSDDVLVKQGKPQGALSTYYEPGECAPEWRQVKDAREAAAKHKSEFGRREADIRGGQQRVSSGLE